MLIFSTTSFTKQAELSIRKLRAFFQFRTIWHILALYNKFSLDHYMATPSLATLRYLRLWDFGDFWSTLEPMLLSPECFLYVQNSSNICLSGLFFNIFHGLFYLNLSVFPVGTAFFITKGFRTAPLAWAGCLAIERRLSF